MPLTVDPDRLRRCYGVVKDLLLRERTPEGHWVGELSTSALSTATAVMALLQVSGQRSAVGEQPAASGGPSPLNSQLSSLNSLIIGGINWLIAHQSEDGGWGDTIKSFSNISTTMLCHATLTASEDQKSTILNPQSSIASSLNSAISRAQQYIDRAGGIPALVARYGKDKTFSVPILTHCALAGLVDWKQITPLPFELACIPARFYKTVRLPVVSYALPALIAIGQVRHHFAPTWNPITRVLRNLAKQRSLAVLERIQPPNGGFLEATPLTSFVTMSLAAMGLHEHPVVRKGVEFIVNSVRPDGSWPIDTNLSTWVTTLAVNALGDDLPEETRLPILNWLLDQQYKEVHPYTNADPGGWAWTDLPGGVPDADDTPGAMLAILELSRQLGLDSAKDRGARSEDSGARNQLSAFRGQQSEDSHREPTAQSPAVATAGRAGSQKTEVRGQRLEVGGDRSEEETHHGGTEAQSCAESDRAASPRSQALDWERTLPDASIRHADQDRVDSYLEPAADWLHWLQNRDGGVPTFCRGWGTLPFDRSSPDITAHALRAIFQWCGGPPSLVQSAWRRSVPAEWTMEFVLPGTIAYTERIGWFRKAFCFLDRAQREDGSWLPLWFGNQHAPDDVNPTYGTAKVLAAYRDCRLLDREEAQRGFECLRANQNRDGGWGAGRGDPFLGGMNRLNGSDYGYPETPSSVEETALAVEALLDDPLAGEHVARGLCWLMDKVEAVHQPHNACEAVPPPPGSPPRTIADPAPIGFYFAKLWYFERLYPLIFAVSCLRRAIDKFPAGTASDGADVSA